MFYNKSYSLGQMKKYAGSASIPRSTDRRVIVAFVNDKGVFDTSDANKAIMKVYPRARDDYRTWYISQMKFALGEIRGVQLQSDTEVYALLVKSATVVEETVIVGRDKKKIQKVEEVVDEKALVKAVKALGDYCSVNRLNVHIDVPTFWSVLEPIVEEYLVKVGVNVSIYSGG